MVNRILFLLLISSVWFSAQASPYPLPNDSAYPLLRLKLVIDSFNYDDIAIGFSPMGVLTYNNQIDSRYLPGINAPEGLSVLSSDGVPLSVYVVALPKQTPLQMRLDVETSASRTITLQRTELDSIPAIYDIWLMDKYSKDSLNLRTATKYIFNIDKTDTASFGTNRFVVVIRQKQALAVHLLNFTAMKASPGAQLNWTTENEQNNTTFSVERSIDNGETFYMLDTLVSNSLGTYSYLDKTPISGTDKYRLKITDLNGSVSYSSILSLDFSSVGIPAATESTSNISVYPNPSNGYINLAITSNSNNFTSNSSTLQTTSALPGIAPAAGNGSVSYSIKIININGSIIKTATSSSNNWHDNLTSLSPGTYFVQVINNTDKSLVGKSTFIKL